MEMKMSDSAMTRDLMTKISEDVMRAMGRTLAICPDPKLPVAIAGAAAALGIVTAILDGVAGIGGGKPSPENILLAGLLAARMGIGGDDGIGQAYRDVEKLKAA